MRSSAVLQRVLAAVLVALLAAIVALLATRDSSPAPAAPQHSSMFDGPTLPPGVRATDFTLTDERGRRVSLAAYRGRVVILTFIHSQCHDVCPFMVEQIKGALDRLGGGQVTALGVSVDPAEDTVAHRRQFLRRHRMEGRLAFLSGPLPALRRVWRSYAMQPVTPKIDHSTFVLLIDRRGIERVGFPADELTPEGLAHDIRVLERQPPQAAGT